MQSKFFLHAVYRHFEFIFGAPEMKSKRKKFKSFINYLVKFYLADSAKFPFSTWNYYHSISHDIDMAVTTNSLENINLKLKRHLGHGYLSSKNAFRKLKSFHEDQISLYTTQICQNKMNKIKPKTLKREKLLLEHLQKFYSLEKADQILNLDYFATEIGCYTSDNNVDYFDKVPSPS